MKIGVIADTHLYRRMAPLPATVLDVFSDTDHIIHAGDIVGRDVITRLEALAPVTAVAGNLDPVEIRARYGDKKIVRLGGLAIGICHGHGTKGGTVERAIGCFAGDRVDCIIFGHSHIPYCRVHDGVLLFNPGSPTDKRRNQYYSVGLLEIDAEIRPRIVYFDKEGVVIEYNNT